MGRPDFEAITAALTVVIAEIRADQIKLREEVAYLKGRVDDGLPKPERPPHAPHNPFNYLDMVASRGMPPNWYEPSKHLAGVHPDQLQSVDFQRGEPPAPKDAEAPPKVD
jgi:hypothetical protein